MKKILCGAMMLLAAAAGFTGCKSNNSTSDEVTITLNGGTSLTITPGEEKRISIQATGYTGKDKLTYTWASSDEKVATVDKNGTVKGITFGTATITATTTIDKKEVKGSLDVKVASVLETLNFTSATISYSYDQNTFKPVNVVSDTFEIAEVKATKEKVYGCLITANVEFYSEGFGYNDQGKMSGPSTGYIINMPGYIAYTDYGMNPDLSDGQGGKIFSKPEDHMTFGTGAWKMIEDNTVKEHGMIAGAITDEAAYLTHIKAAVAALNEEDLDTWFAEQTAARKETMKGGMLIEYTYDAESDDYYGTFIPAAFATSATANVESNPNSLYMYKINGFKAVVKPLGTTDIYGNAFTFGVTVEEDDVTGELTVTSNKVEYGPEIEYHSARETASSVAARDGLMSFSVEEMRAMINKGNAADLAPIRRK